ncbi:hypothetical protein [Mycolicibacterium sphagni]|uniref:Methyltransferase n=1 Tax=Mycolicibacterium sphagni TaxID=1786 RepID=A0A255DBQ2_9MYCO|nr:hypothetical protein [Mycolicibacterium sphagni]OYN74352.1 hypothetical protein CG716_28845 [Mycolicibacterium sphagni]
MAIDQLGEPAWSRDEIVDSVTEFARLYATRPLQNNQFGMGASHMFATWFIARHLRPSVVIESGVWRGQSTWLIEQACPQAEVHSIDLFLDRREYVSPRVHYHNIDFSEIDWSGIAGPDALIVFDDHQNAYNRLIYADWFGFEHIIFDDNYPPHAGDFYTLKKVFAGAGFGNVSSDDASQRYRSLSARATRKIGVLAQRFGAGEMAVIPQYQRDRVAANLFDAAFLKKHLRTYLEFPPLFETGLDEPTPKPLLDESWSDRVPDLYAERANYNWICYAQLNTRS